jgi:hypothetical protein
MTQWPAIGMGKESQNMLALPLPVVRLGLANDPIHPQTRPE